MVESLDRLPATDEDLDLIFNILKASLGPYVAQTWGEWDEAFQRARFDKATRAADHSLLQLDGVTVGCLCLKESDVELRLVRLFLLPEFQGRGLGTSVMTEIIDAAESRGVPIRLRVLRVNPARRLYERLGFDVTDETETHFMMARRPTAAGRRSVDVVAHGE